MLCRIFYRLGLFDNEEDFLSVIAIGRNFALVTGHPIRYIDIIFVSFGQVGAKPEFGQKKKEFVYQMNQNVNFAGLINFVSTI